MLSPALPSRHRQKSDCLRCQEADSSPNKLAATLGSPAIGLRSRHLHRRWKDLEKLDPIAQESTPSDARCTLTRCPKIRFLKGRKLWLYVTGQRHPSKQQKDKTEDAFALRLEDWDGERITTFHSCMRFLWDQLAASEPVIRSVSDAKLVSTHRERTCLHQFLMGVLDDLESWVYKIKTRSDGTIDRYKARLVAKGFTQEYDIDYEETFTLVARLSYVRTLITVFASRHWPFFQMDVKNAFLNGELTEEVYMQLPLGFSQPSGFSHKGIQDLKRFLGQHFEMKDLGPLSYFLGLDCCQGIHSRDLKRFLGQHFEMKDLGPLSYFLGLEVSSSSDSYYLTQFKHTSDLISKAGITDSKIVDTPIEYNNRLNTHDGEPFPNATLYRQLVGSFVYLTVTRLDISYAVHIVSQFMAASRSLHYAVAYSDADWAGDPTDRRSTTGYCFLLGDSLISWRSKKQSVVARSSAKAEYQELADTTAKLL
uniref:Reverse transcriptase Ty1/copia-type domain-containing protein n=1 Tax=Fagus sylvatica TaxID=28930 RepID=A0A2N9GFC2_FAGSY